MTDDKEKLEEDKPVELPEFKTEYFWAFCTIMLYKLGGFEVIRLEHLEKYDYEKDCPYVTWDEKNKAFIMRLKDMDVKKPSAISMPGKIRKKMLRKILKDNFS